MAVIGMACRYPGAGDVEQYWSNLLAGVESVVREGSVTDAADRGPRLVRALGRVSDVELFDAEHFRVPPAEALIMDPQQRLLLEVAAAALEDAGYAGRRSETVGVFVGCGENEYYRDFVLPSSTTGTDDVRVTLGNEKDFLAPRLAFKLGLTGPSITVQTSCATSLTAVALACQALAAGDCDIALAGGVSLLMPDTPGYTYAEGGILSSDGRCRTFDAAATGAVPGSGVGVVVLKRDDDAQADRDHRRAVVRGWAVNNDGGSRAGFTVPNVEGQATVVRTALSRAGLSPRHIGYIEAHGTGTAIGDPVEVEALRRVFADEPRSQRCVLGAVKPNIGHTDAAAGVAGLIKATLAVEHGTIPGTLHFEAPNPEIDLEATPFRISSATTPWPDGGLRTAGVSAFGLGGTNAHVVLQQASARVVTPARRARHVLALSARTPEELVRARALLADYLESGADLASPDRLADVAFTLGVGRSVLPRRWAAVVGDSEEAVRALRDEATPPSSSRWTLVLRGSPQQLEDLVKGQVSAEPLLLAAREELTSARSEALSSAARGALSALVLVRAVRAAGLPVGRVQAPPWCRPAVRWLEAGADPDTLADALTAVSGPDDRDEQPVPTERAGQLVVGPDFDLGAAVAAAWTSGATVDWAAYHGDEERGRVPLPTYPYTRRRYWLDRGPARAAESPMPSHGRGADGGHGLEAVVRAAWCEVLGLAEVADDAHFVDDLGGDSLYAVEIGAVLQERLSVEFPIDLPFLAPTVRESARHIAGVLQSEELRT
jgi:phthiocerol/phenolphthiocerol synthesis type-I polyketide synthase E